jgi:hypothetical protein
MTEMGTVTVVRNAAIVAAASVGSNGLSLLPSGLLRSLCALWLLLALCLLGALRLRLLGALRLRLLGALWLLAFCLLGALWLLALRLLGALWLHLLGALLRLRFLCLLRLRLVLRRLGFSSATALFLLAFLCECRNGGSEK